MSSKNGTATWAARHSVGVPLGFLIYGVVMSMLAAPGLVVIYLSHPESMPFAWLALIITLLSSIGHTRRNGLDDDIVNRLESLSRSEKYQYMMNLMFIVSGIITFHIAGIALISAFTAYYLGYPVIGILMAVAFPPIDAYVGRNHDLALGTLGYFVASSLLTLLSLISGVSSASAEAAAEDAKFVI